MRNSISRNLRRPYFAAVTGTFRLLSRGINKRFHENLKQPKQSQDKLLSRLLNKMAQTAYGQHYGIRGDEDYRRFRNKVPVQAYEDMAAWLARQQATNQAIITPDRVVHTEPTSGSSSKKKPIPYTRPLLRSFSNMFRIWAYDLLCHGPGFNSGRIFISISPATSEKEFNDDLEYLSQPLRFLLSPFLLSPPKSSSETFVHDLAVTLLKAEDLEMVSVWSPSYLLTVLDYIRDNRENLAPLLPSPAREALLTDPLNWEDLWPNLNFISCWDNALAEPLAGLIRKQFPNVLVQGKGLLATEAPVTIPLNGVVGGVPLIDEVFLEFEAANGDIKRLHELQTGEHYQLIISQIAGLTRYRLGDVVEIQGRCGNTPTLKFIGRARQVCDLVGEKLSETFVRQVLEPLVPTGLFLLVPYRMGYILLTDYSSDVLAEKAEESLCRAYQYALARRQGQLAPLKVQQVPDLLTHLQEFHQDQGMKLGDIKDTALITDPDKGEQLLARCCDNQIFEAVQATV
jgi:hypothetical protein